MKIALVSNFINILNYLLNVILVIIKSSNIKKPMVNQAVVTGPTRVYLLDLFCSVMSPYLFFISLLYLDLYVLGDDAWIS